MLLVGVVLQRTVAEAEPAAANASRTAMPAPRASAFRNFIEINSLFPALNGTGSVDELLSYHGKEN